MEETSGDTVARVYARLKGLRDNVDKLSRVEDTYVKEYHVILDNLDKVGIDTAEFRIEESEIRPRVTGIRDDRPSYSDKKYVAKALLLSKLDAILIYFELITADKPKRVGFSPPDKRS